MMVPVLVAVIAASAVLTPSRAQSNYDMQGNSIEYNSQSGLPDSTILDGKVTKLDDISPQILLNRTKAILNCSSGAMQIELKFDEPFLGIVYADFNRASACQVTGRGDLTAKLTLPLKGCGTKQDPQRVFTNNIVVRFHPALEMDGDEVITIVCRYPPPVAPPPALPPSYIKDSEGVAVASRVAPPLQGFQILLIICGILFLSLVLLGLGCSYYLLRRKRFQVVRRHPLSTGTGSEITKLSGSTLGNISMFEGLKIPRAHAALGAAAASGSVSGSEAALISGADTLPSDYPSESPSSAHSEVEDTDTRSLRRSVSSAGSYDNKAFVHEASAGAAAAAAASGYYEEYAHHRSQTKEVISAAGKRPPPEPKFDVQLRVKKAAPPPPTPTPPPSESEISIKTAERNLTTILEREEDLRSSFHQAKTSFSYVPNLEPLPSHVPTPPPPVVYSTINRRHHDEFRSHDVVDTMETRAPPSVTSTDITETEMVEVSPTKYSPPPPPVVPQSLHSIHRLMHQKQQQMNQLETTVDLIEPPVVVSRRPEIKSHVVDDVFLRTITEKRTIEDIERTRRKVTDYKKSQAPPPPPAKWDVTIRNYPGPRGAPSEDAGTDWESYSETSSMSAFPPPPPPDRYSSQYDRNDETHRRLAQYRSYMDEESEEVYKATLAANPKVQNWDVLVRVLEPPIQPDAPDDVSDVTSIMDTCSTLTVEDRKKWRDIITTESTLRTMLTEATVREDYERIRRDERYEKLFDPEKWDVIIRVLAPPHQYDQKSTGSGSNKYKKKSSSDWETRSSRRSSLPTLYEYDSDGGSSVRTLTASGLGAAPVRPSRWRRTSASSIGDGSEATTDYGGESYYRTTTRTMGPPRGAGYYDDELREVMVRSRSQPTLLDDDGPLEIPERGHWGGAYTLTRQSYMSTTQSSQMTHGGSAQTQGRTVRRWFPDNTDSEASYK